jgi:hypothetical protein
MSPITEDFELLINLKDFGICICYDQDENGCYYKSISLRKFFQV